MERQDGHKHQEPQRYIDVPEEIYTVVPTVGEVKDEQERVTKVLDMLKSQGDSIKRDSESFFSVFKKLERYLEVQLEVRFQRI